MSFVHLHLHSDYSLLDGIGMCSEYAELCIQYKHKYLCVTDHGMMSAVPAQTQACLDYGLIPIYGIEVYLNDYHHLVVDFKNLSDIEKKLCRDNFHLNLYARDTEGYKNLVRVSSDAWIRGFYYKPRTNKETLRAHAAGVIASSACIVGEIPAAIRKGDYELARTKLREYREIFPEFYLEIMLLDWDEQREVNKGLVRLSQEEECPLVLTNDVHYAEKDDAFIQKIALLLNSREGTIRNPSGLQFDSKELWYKSEAELDEAWQSWYSEIIPRELYEVAKRNTVVIAEKCTGVEMDLSPKLPTLPNADDILIKEVYNAMKLRGFNEIPEYRTRLKKELDIIFEKGFASYFLIMKEIVDHAKIDMHSIVGPGRGSGPGFLVNYLLDLCSVDPIKYNLLSERFLSPHRGGRFAKLKFKGDPIG